VVILAYHRVLSGEDLVRSFVPPGMYVRAEVFEAQMRFVKEHFELLSLERLLEHWTDGSLDEAKRYCVVTFDDGWRDNYLHAYPVLRQMDIPATIFLATRFVGTDEWFWPERLAYILLNRSGGPSPGDDDRKWSETEVETEIGRWKCMRRADIERSLDELIRERGASLPRERAVMSWDEAAEMSRHGISFGSHSVTHAVLTREGAEDVDRELRGSLRELRERQVNYLPVFCYPNGDYSRGIIDQVRAAGYMAAVCSESGVEARAPGNLFALRRVGIHNDVAETMPLFAFRLAGLDETLRRHLAPKRRDARPVIA
jgi:peptidoglycan/xylan/chitin deacetylase (PgdA/CDA1 family)